MKVPASLRISSGQGAYSVDFLQSISELLGELARLPHGVFLVDKKIAELYSTELASVFNSHPTHTIDATEETKSLRGVEKVLEFFQGANVVKNTPVIVIGGGIVQDIAAFAAHVYYRGLRWFFVPTTLLAMSDSCIGAKCGINFGRFKNQLGLFYSPTQIWICLRFLETLGENEIRSGYGEILKLHLTRSKPERFQELRETISSQGWRNPQLPRFIHQSLEVKKSVIEEDEYEQDLRRILNYGHTFGHALEAVTQHAIPHGLAVAWGVDLANFIAWRSELLAEADFRVVHDFVAQYFAWPLPRGLTALQLIDGTRRDKKVVDGKINLVLPERLGGLRIVSQPYTDEFAHIVEDYVSNWNIAPR